MSTAAQILTRVPFIPRLGFDVNLLEKARTLIGYSPRVLSQSEAVEQRAKAEGSLAYALEKLGIEPFSVDSVRNYQRLQVRRLERTGSNKFVQYMHRGGEGTTCRYGETVVVSLGIVASILTTIGLMVFFGWDGSKPASLLRLCLLPSVSVWAAWSICMWARFKKAYAITARWNKPAAASYQAIIPEFAISRMVEVKEQLPNATFYIEELQGHKEELRTEHHKPIPPDPFLVVEFQGVCAYLDVWEEPEFEGRRTV